MHYLVHLYTLESSLVLHVKELYAWELFQVSYVGV